MAAREGVDTNLPAGLEFRKSQPSRLPAEDHSFDVLFAWSAFEHVADPVSLAFASLMGSLVFAPLRSRLLLVRHEGLDNASFDSDPTPPPSGMKEGQP
jgi:hypothetical protein